MGLVFLPGRRPSVGSGVVPEYISAQLIPRQTQIFLGELLAALPAVHMCWSDIQGTRLVHFCGQSGRIRLPDIGLRQGRRCCSGCVFVPARHHHGRVPLLVGVCGKPSQHFGRAEPRWPPMANE